MEDQQSDDDGGRFRDEPQDRNGNNLETPLLYRYTALGRRNVFVPNNDYTSAFDWDSEHEMVPQATDTDQNEENRGNGQIPSWSLQDRVKRAVVRRQRWKSILGSNALIATVYFFFYVLPQIFSDPHHNEIRSACITAGFILLQIPVTLIQAMPDEDTSNEEVNKRVNATILMAMTLYPCVGLWLLSRDERLTWRNAWDVLDLDNLHTFKEQDRFQWGFVFPCFFWATSAIILLRDSNFAFIVDRVGVISGANGKAITALFRRNPSFQEVWTHKLTRAITFSLWTIVPDRFRPSGKAGRFAFQVISPVVLMFEYVGLRFILFAIEELSHIVHHPEDYTRALAIKNTMGPEYGDRIAARVIVWGTFTFFCIFIRFVVGRRDFVSTVVPDPQSFKKRWEDWSRTIVESKRTRILWAFRGLANAAVPYYIWNSKSPEPSNAIDWFGWYIYFGVYFSFLFEGIGALWFGLAEAERGCHLQTPFSLLVQLSFWTAFNAFIQPLGFLVNYFAYLINKEYKLNLALRELWGPVLLNERNHFRFKVKQRKTVEVPTKAEIRARLDEWITTWARKRRDIGRDEDSYHVKDFDISNDTYPTFSGPKVFHGTMFPTKYEWLHMRDHYEHYLTLQPWEKENGPEKFLRWYPSYREEIMTLLREPYDFENRREVWMFGYGSLISPDNPPHGLNDTQRKQIIPYWLKKQAGYRRVWNYRHGPCGINAFGLEEAGKGEGMNVCGCVYPIDYEAASDLFSIREEGYELLLVHEDYFEPMHADFRLPKGIGYVWIAGQPTRRCPGNEKCPDINCKRHNPTEDSPILQSYIDVVLEGALRYRTAGPGHTDGMNFAASIVASTVGWDYPWYNDRLLAGRPWYFSQNYELIDGLLSTCSTSREAFVNRLRTSLVQLSEKREMLRLVKDSLVGWADGFFGPSTAASDVSSLSTSSHSSISQMV